MTATQPSVPPAVSPHASHNRRSPVHGNADEQVVGANAGFQPRYPGRRVESVHSVPRRVLDAPLVEGTHDRFGRLRRHRHRRIHRTDHLDVGGVPHPTIDQILMQQQCTLERCRRALERDPQDRDYHPPPAKRWQRLGQPLCTRHRVVLVTVRDKARCGRRVVVGAQGDGQHVGLVSSAIGDDVPGFRIDRGNRLLAELHSRHRHVPIQAADLRPGATAEQHVQLREPEDERIVSVEQRDIHLVGQRL